MFQIAKKDLLQYFKDKKAVVLSLLLPIVLITLFALAFGGLGGHQKSSPVKLLLSDEDQTELTQEVFQKLNEEDGLELEKFPLAEAQNQIKKGKRIAVLVLYKGFQDSINAGKDAPMELFYDQAKEIEMGLLQQALYSNLFGITTSKSIKAKVRNWVGEKNPELSSSELSEIQSQINEQFVEFETEEENAMTSGNSLPMTALVSEQKDGNLGLIQAVAGTAILMLLFSVAASGATILGEKEEGTLKRLLISPITPTSILYGKMLATLCMALLQLAVMFTFAWLALGLDIFINFPALIIMILATAFACSSFGIFLASICKTRKQVEQFSTIIILIISAIGGSMIPLFIMPPIMQKIAVISINYWAIDGFFDIFWRQLPLMDIYPKILFLLGFGTLLTLISVFSFKKNILKLV